MVAMTSTASMGTIMAFFVVMMVAVCIGVFLKFSFKICLHCFVSISRNSAI